MDIYHFLRGNGSWRYSIQFNHLENPSFYLWWFSINIKRSNIRNCHNPGQPKTKSPGVVLLSVRKTTPHHPTPHHTGDDYNSDSSRQPRKLTFGMQLYSNTTRRYMEDDLNIFENGRRPQLFRKRKTTSFQAVLGNLGSWLFVCSFILTQLEDIWKTTSIFLKMEDDLNYFKKGRRPYFFWKWKTTSKK
jgi:hypothetical protein